MYSYLTAKISIFLILSFAFILTIGIHWLQTSIKGCDVGVLIVSQTLKQNEWQITINVFLFLILLQHILFFQTNQTEFNKFTFYLFIFGLICLSLSFIFMHKIIHEIFIFLSMTSLLLLIFIFNYEWPVCLQSVLKFLAFFLFFLFSVLYAISTFVKNHPDNKCSWNGLLEYISLILIAVLCIIARIKVVFRENV